MDVSSVSNPGLVLPAVPETRNPQWLVENQELIRNIKAVDPTELFGQDTELTFGIDRDTKHLLIRVINKKTQQVMFQVPPDYVLALARTLGNND